MSTRRRHKSANKLRGVFVLPGKWASFLGRVVVTRLLVQLLQQHNQLVQKRPRSTQQAAEKQWHPKSQTTAVPPGAQSGRVQDPCQSGWFWHLSPGLQANVRSEQFGLEANRSGQFGTAIELFGAQSCIRNFVSFSDSARKIAKCKHNWGLCWLDCQEQKYNCADRGRLFCVVWHSGL